MCSTPPKSGKRGGGVSNDGECDEIPLFRKGSPVVAQGVNGDDANDIDVDVEGGGEDRQEEVEKSRASPTPGALSAQPVNSPQKSSAGQTVRRSKRRLRIVDNYGDDSDYGLPEEESESEDEKLNVTAARRVSSKKPKCGGGDPWAKKLKKPITIDTDEKLSLNELVTDLEVGVTTTYDGRKISEEVNELAVEYVQSKLDRPEEEQSLLALIGDKGALTTEQRLAVDKMMRKPELGRLLRDIEASAPEGLHNRVVDVRVMLRPKDAGMVPHRDSINLKYDRTVSTWLAGPSQKPPLFFVKLMSGPDATPARGPYEPGEIVVPKVNGRIVVKGPNARGEEVRVVHGVGPGDVTSLTLVKDYITTRKDGQPTSDEDRHSARKSVVAHTTRAPPPGATVNPYADGLVWPENAPRTPGSRRATEANNAMVYHDGKMVKKAVVKANSCSHDGCLCTSAEVGKCVCGEDHAHVKNASVGGRTATVGGVKATIPQAVMEGKEAPTPLQQRAMDQRSEDSSRGGRANYSGEQKGREKSTNELKAEGGKDGDPDLKATGAGTGPGNVSGSTVPYTARLEGFPDIPLYCSKCEGDWRSFEGVKRRNNGQLGIPQGIVDDDNRVVFLRQERHRGCGNCRCKPPEDATVTRNGVPYEVKSGQDARFRNLA